MLEDINPEELNAKGIPGVDIAETMDSGFLKVLVNNCPKLCHCSCAMKLVMCGYSYDSD